jgi:ribose transport system permease protein
MKNGIKTTAHLSDYTIYFLTALFFLFLTFTTESFFSVNNLYALIYGVSIQFIAMIGFTVLTILGEIDLSVSAVYGLSGTIAGTFLQTLRWPFLPSMLMAILICTIFGILVGTVVVRFKLNSMMVTLGTMTLLKGINSILFNRMYAGIYPAAYRNLAKIKLLNVHLTIIIMAAAVITLEFCLKKTTVFKQLYYIGYSRITSIIYGIRAGIITAVCYGFCALTAAFGGIIATSRITHSDINTGNGLELLFIAAVVVSGGSLDGGRGSMLKAATGLLFLALLTNGMVIYRLDPFVQQVGIGLVLILSVMVDSYMKSRRT